jgi:cytochrome P450
MPFTNPAHLKARLRHDLPPTAPLPSILQTLGCRWFPFSYLEWCDARFGARFTVYPVDMPPLVFLSDPKEIRAVVSAPADVLHPGAGSAPITPLIGKRAFILCEEDEHLCGRNATVPAFHRKVVQEYETMIAEVVEREVATWPLDAAVALHPYIRAVTLKAVLKAIFKGEDDATLRRLQQRVLDMLGVTASFVLQEPWLRHLPGWRTTWRRFVKQREDVETFLFTLISRRRREDEQHGDLLDALLAASSPDGSPMSTRQVHDHLMSMIVAGHETTAAEVAWAFQLVAHHSEVQNRLVEEIDNGTEQAYLTATVNETLRHRPAFLFAIPRKVTRQTEIGGFTYHPPAQLVACTYLMHHNPALYPDPHTFLPERFLGQPQQAGTWLPWGAGRKRCVGRHFALLEMQAILRETLATRRVLPVSPTIEHPRWRSAILVPHAGGRVMLHRRRP